ncbi:MAG TPA: bi-domain-containing oxidoreductase [Vicinamibacterales bacterium]|nr:bi-domain-containing oxidoreductase [Vicinamibacterales bacterium]
MKQILQNLGTGVTEVADVPCPSVAAGQLLLRTSRTLISAGTERMLIDFGKANPLEKARRQPDKVRQVLEKVKTDGLIPAIEAVRNKLDQPLALGYCNVGRVIGIGRGVHGFADGDRIASNGKHAEVVTAPVNLCARIPDTVSDDHAAFTVIGAIALQGIRLVQPTLGETVVVTGLGLIGQMTVQLLRAHGCRVLGIDVDAARLELARTFGAEVVNVSDSADPVAAATEFSRGRGVDAVLVTAATTSSEPMHQAALMCRKRGRIVLVGVTGLELSRDDFFKKELSFQVSCSYGPGRYDPAYEEKGHDYPVGYVRWTEQRNFEAVLDMMADGRLDPQRLISHRFALQDAQAAYEIVSGAEPSLGILLNYPEEVDRPDAEVRAQTVTLPRSSAAAAAGAPAVGVIGAGNYALAVLIPAFRTAAAKLVVVASQAGVSATHAARKYGFDRATTQTDAVFRDGAVDTVVVATRHDSHTPLVLNALEAGRHVFVEKPLCLTLQELASIESAYKQALVKSPSLSLTVGFNRRFAPHVRKMKALLEETSAPKSFLMTVNAGAVPADHWTQDQAIGGGRIIGEACHFVDLLRFLAGSPITGHSRSTLASATGDTVSLQLEFGDGSIGTIYYVATGAKAFPKERLEVFVSGRVLQLDNFRVLRGFGWPRFRTMRLWKQDKGQQALVAAFVESIREGRPAPIPFDELVEVSRVTIELASTPNGH